MWKPVRSRFGVTGLRSAAAGFWGEISIEFVGSESAGRTDLNGVLLRAAGFSVVWEGW